VKITAGKRFFHFAVSFFVIVVLVWGCAKQGSPPGGPEDITPPDILVTEPPSGSVQVPTDSRIIIQFSEAIDRESAQKALFISPLPQPEPKIKYKSDAIIITPRENLQANKTYVITVGTDLKDAHRVSLNQSISIAFSTGTAIDSGKISGTVFRDGKGTAGISLALFEKTPEADNGPIDSLIPDYLTQSGKDGSFTFNYMPPGKFALVAFEDKNKNKRINPSREMVGVPFTQTILDTSSNQLGGIDIQLHLEDTSRIALRSVSINPDRLIKVRLNQKIDVIRAQALFATAALTEEKDSSVSISIYDFIPLDVMPASDFILSTSSLTIGEKYNLKFDLQPLYPQIEDSLRFLSYPFEFTEGSDVAPPVIVETIPSDKAVNVNPDSLFFFRFSESLDSAMLARAIRLVTAEEDTSGVSITRSDSFSFSGKPEERLDYGRKYQILIDAPSIMDAAGNKMSDSATTIIFSTIGLDTLGQLSGQIDFSDPDDAAYPVIIAFNPAREGVASRTTVSPRQSTYIVNLLPGYYTVTAYLDRNGNGQYDYGSVMPYRLAEPFTAPVDTFRVRSRFESSGVKLKF